MRYIIPEGTRYWFTGMSLDVMLNVDEHTADRQISSREVTYTSVDLTGTSVTSYSFKLPPNDRGATEIMVYSKDVILQPRRQG